MTSVSESKQTNNAKWSLDGDPSSGHALPIAAALCCRVKMAGNLLTATPNYTKAFVHSGQFIVAKGPSCNFHSSTVHLDIIASLIYPTEDTNRLL